MRAAIDVDDHRVLLRWIEVRREEHPVPVVVLAVGAFDCAEQSLSGLVVFERILGCDQIADQLSVSRDDVHHARNVEAAVVVDESGAVFVEGDRVPAFLGGQPDRLAEPGLRHSVGASLGLAGSRDPDLDPEQMILDRGDLRRGVVDKPAVVAKVLDVGINSGQPSDSPEGVAEVKVAVAVADIGAVDE